MSNKKNSSYLYTILADILEWKKGLSALCFWFVPALCAPVNAWTLGSAHSAERRFFWTWSIRIPVPL